MENLRLERATRLFENRIPDNLAEECSEIANRNYNIGEDIDRVKLYNHVLSIAYNKFSGAGLN